VSEFTEVSNRPSALPEELLGALEYYARKLRNTFKYPKRPPDVKSDEPDPWEDR
jgi:hypothetical protein